MIPDVQRTLKTRVGRLYLEWKPAEPQYLTLQKDGKIIHIGRKYVSGNRWERQFPHEHGDYRAGRRP